MSYLDLLQQNPNVQLVISAIDLKTIIRESIDEVLSEHIAQESTKEVLLTPDEAAERFSRSKTTLWRWEKAGYLSPTRIGGGVFYKESDILKIMEG